MTRPGRERKIQRKSNLRSRDQWPDTLTILSHGRLVGIEHKRDKNKTRFFQRWIEVSSHIFCGCVKSLDCEILSVYSTGNPNNTATV